MSTILIRGGQVIDPSQGTNQLADLLIVDRKINAIEPPGKIELNPGTEEIQLNGEWVLPGLIDVHVHLREPGQTQKETIATGTRASVAGGFTHVACMANTYPVNDNALVTQMIIQKAKESGACHVYPIGAVTKDLKGKTLADIGSMVEAGAVAISDDGMPVMNSLIMRRAMEYANVFSIPVISHAEDTHLRDDGFMNEGKVSFELGLKGNPSAAEEIMVAREIALCRLTRCKLHIAHLSTREGLEHVRRAKQDGLPVTAEVCPHHLLLTEDEVLGYRTECKMAPPLRTEEDIIALREGLADGTIDMIATDHAPHARADKDGDFESAAFGITGLETAVASTLKLVREDKIPLEKWLLALTSNPAKLIQKDIGHLKKGYLANITILSADESWTYSEDVVASKSYNSPFLGKELKGKIKYTIIDGEIAYPFSAEVNQ